MKKPFLVLIIYLVMSLGILLLFRSLWDHHYDKGANYLNIIFSIEQGLYGIIPLLFLMRRGISYKHAIMYLGISFMLTLLVWLLFTHNKSFLTAYLMTLQGFLYVEVPHLLGVLGAVGLSRGWERKKSQ